MRTLIASVVGLVLVGQPQSRPRIEVFHDAKPEDIRTLGRALYQCGKVSSDREWLDAIEGTKSPVRFKIDRTKSDRDWAANHCADVLDTFGMRP